MWSAWWGAGQDLQWEGREVREPHLGAKCCFLSLSCLIVPKASIRGCFLSSSPYAGSRGTRETDRDWVPSSREEDNTWTLNLNVYTSCSVMRALLRQHPVVGRTSSSLLTWGSQGASLTNGCFMLQYEEYGPWNRANLGLNPDPCIAVWPWVIDFVCLDRIFVLGKMRVIKSTF